MRRLIYVPIIHTDPDLGELLEGIEERARAVVGERGWQKHKEVVHLYWQAIADYWAGQDVLGLKIFQDGMPVDGEVGHNIVKSLANEDSINYKIIEQLMEKGAALVKTEDPELVKEEYFLTRKLIEEKSLAARAGAVFRYRRQKDRLLRARDAYIVKSIDENLKEGETGVCFLGAYHQLLPGLPNNIEVIALKDPQKVREYYQKLTSNKPEEQVNKLGRYLTMPITREAGEYYE